MRGRRTVSVLDAPGKRRCCARPWDREQAPQLGGPDSKPPTLRLWLTKGKATDLGYLDGFREMRLELPDPAGIETVVIRCDRTTDIATIKVERMG